MATAVQTSLVTHVVGLLPRPLLRLLDAWSHRVAQNRARQRQQRLARRPAAPARPLPYI